jgi:hypothetical protein
MFDTGMFSPGLWRQLNYEPGAGALWIVTDLSRSDRAIILNVDIETYTVTIALEHTFAELGRLLRPLRPHFAVNALSGSNPAGESGSSPFRSTTRNLGPYSLRGRLVAAWEVPQQPPLR